MTIYDFYKEQAQAKQWKCKECGWTGNKVVLKINMCMFLEYCPICDSRGVIEVKKELKTE